MMKKIVISLLAVIVFATGSGFRLQQWLFVNTGDWPGSVALIDNLAHNGSPEWSGWVEVRDRTLIRAIYPGQALCINREATLPRAPGFRIEKTVRDTSVDVYVYNIIATEKVDFFMSAYGTGGVGGTKVATLNAGTKYPLSMTIMIPAQLRGLDRLEIRMQGYLRELSRTQSFYNITSSTCGYSGTPAFQIIGIVPKQSVTIKTYDFPPNMTFEAWMMVDRWHSRKIYTVGTFSSGAGGTLIATFNIPAGLQTERNLVLHLRSTLGGYYGFIYFQNK